jgi:hypothetical protein
MLAILRSAERLTVDLRVFTPEGAEDAEKGPVILCALCYENRPAGRPETVFMAGGGPGAMTTGVNVVT